MRLLTLLLLTLLLAPSQWVFADTILEFDPRRRATPTGVSNLVTDPYILNTAAWGTQNATLVSRAARGPNNAYNGGILVEDSTASDVHSCTWFHSKAASAIRYKVSFYAKRFRGVRHAKVLVFNGSFSSGASITTSLNNGSIVSSAGGFGGFTGVSGSSRYLGDGWVYCEIFFTTDAVADMYILPRMTEGDGAADPNDESYNGDGTSAIILWGVNLEEVS